MTRPRMFLFLFISGVLVCGLLVLRHAVRTAAPEPPPGNEDPTESRQLRAVDDWQCGIRLDTQTDYAGAMEKLRREERRQRPEEQRN
jgi:hypothetical protein